MKRMICLILLSLLAFQAQASFTASVDRARLTEGESLDLTLESDDPTQFGKPDLTPLGDAFEILGTRQVNRLTTLDGQAQATTRWIITLRPTRSGALQIPALRMGNSQTQPIALQVLKAEDADEQQKLSPVFIDASLDHESVYVQAQAILTLRIYHSVSLYDDSSLSPLQIDDAKVEQLGQPRTYEKEINGVRHGVIEVRFAIFPQHSGELTIPALNFSATRVARNNPGDTFGALPGKRLRVSSPEIPLEVKPKPADYPADAPWLPARAVALSESWAPQPEQAKAGEALTRNLMLRVEGLSSAQLPPLPQALPAGLRHYPDQPQLAEEISVLGFGVEAFDEEVQPAFAHRHRTLAREPVAQRLQVLRFVRRDEHRVQPVGGMQPRRPRADLPERRPPGGIDRRHHLRHYARVARARQRGVAVGVELGRVEMAVAVDQPHVSAGRRLRGQACPCRMPASSSGPAAGCPGPAAVRPRTG